MVKTKIEIEEMLKRADRLNRLDSYVAELINNNQYDTVNSKIFDVQSILNGSYLVALDRGTVYNTTSGQVVPIPSNSTICVYKDVTRNILYVGTATAGVWEFNLTTKVGKVYNTTSGAGAGSQLPDNNVHSVFKDSTNNILYAGTNSGVWQYNVTTDTGKIYNTTSGAGVGSQLPDNIVHSVFKDSTNNILYVGTRAGGVWEYTVGTDTGKIYNTVGGARAGSQLPDNNVHSVFKDSTNNILYAGTISGVWQYTVGTDTGKVYNTVGGAGAGSQLPDNNVSSVFKDSTNNILYAGTISGVWQYNVTTDTGKIYNTVGGAGVGSQLPDNIVISIFKDTTNNILYADTNDGVWEYNVGTDTGKVYNTTSGATNGSQLPSNTIYGIYKDATRNVFYAATSAGVWQYAYSQNINYNGTQTRTVTYQQFTTDILNEPIMIDHIRLMCSDSTQLTKPIKLYYYTPTGKVESKYYSTLNNRMATDGDNTIIDINLPKPIVFGSENYFALDILPSTTVFFSIFYRQINKWELLNNIIGFRDNQFDSENSKTL